MSTLQLPTKPAEEVAIIACCLVGGIETSLTAIETVNPDSFFNRLMREAFALIEEIATAGKEVNSYTLGSRWQEIYGKPLPEDFLGIEDRIPSAANLPYYVEAVTEAWRKRRIVECADTLLTRSQTEVKSDVLVAEAEAFLFGEDIRSISVNDSKQATRILTDDLERRHSLQGKLSGIATGFHKFDNLTDGLQLGEQTIIAARPSMGKTAIGLNILQHACLLRSVPSVFVSLEMSTAALMRRVMSSFCEIPMGDIRRGTYTEGQFKSFTTFTLKSSKFPLWIVDGVRGLDISKLCAVVRRLCRKHSAKLVIIDYLQKIRPSYRHEKRTYEVAEISGQLKALAVSTNTALLTMAQLNRDSDKDKPRMPRLSDLADSAQIERDADTVALIHREKASAFESANLIIAKQRDGELGMVNLNFNGAYCRFQNEEIGNDYDQQS
jgi:replicative DNA helicase